MPALFSSAIVEKRQQDECPNGYVLSGDVCYDPWWLYGRWVLLGAIIVGAFLLFCCFSCITARRRRRMGRPPLRGTGWAAPPPYGGYPPNAGNQYYNGGQPYQPQGNWQQPPPSYGAQDGSHFGKSNNQPFGQESGSIELQQPGQSFQRGGDHVYQSPPGPPPGKGDGIIR